MTGGESASCNADLTDSSHWNHGYRRYRYRRYADRILSCRCHVQMVKRRNRSASPAAPGVGSAVLPDATNGYGTESTPRACAAHRRDETLQHTRATFPLFCNPDTATGIAIGLGSCLSSWHCHARTPPSPPTATNPALPLPTRRRARPHLADSWQDGWSETSGSGLVQLVILVFGL